MNKWKMIRVSLTVWKQLKHLAADMGGGTMSTIIARLLEHYAQTKPQPKNSDT